MRSVRLPRRLNPVLPALCALTLAAATAVAVAPSPARAADLGSATLAGTTSVGLHNTYNDKAEYT
jgi:hypothetical protein